MSKDIDTNKEKSKADELAETIPTEQVNNPLLRKENTKPPTNDYRDDGEFILEKGGKPINDLRGEERALAIADHERTKDLSK